MPVAAYKKREIVHRFSKIVANPVGAMACAPPNVIICSKSAGDRELGVYNPPAVHAEAQAARPLLFDISVVNQQQALCALAAMAAIQAVQQLAARRRYRF